MAASTDAYRVAASRYSPTQIDLELARKSFKWFATQAWSYVDPAPLVWTWASEAICEHLAWISAGDIRFLLINIPPRFAKSTLCSVLWPAWEWVTKPHIQFLTASYALQLAGRDALKSRRLIQSAWYQKNWGHVFRLSSDEYLKRQYSNNAGGRRVATSVDAAVTGEGGNRLIVDDPHNAKEAESDVIRVDAHRWWDDSMGSRMNDQNVDSWMVIGQRTHEDDLFGHIEQKEDMGEIVKLVLPNEYDPKRSCVTVNYKTGKKWKDPRKRRGELLSSERLDAQSTKRLKRKMSESKYALQYNQDPKAGGGKILKREFWRKWEDAEPPECSFVFSVWDTALADNQQADYSAVTDWGVFKYKPVMENPDTGERFQAKEQNCLILIGAARWQIPYWKLRRNAQDRYKKVKPDTVLIEKKVSGISLIQDFRRMNMRVTPISIDHGGRVKIDINERAELAAPMLEQGSVFYMPRQWAEDVIDECAKVPGGTNDDWASTVCMALMWLRRKGELGTWEDAKDDGEVRLFKKKRQSIYG